MKDRATPRRSASGFRTVGATTLWSADEAEQVLDFLDALRSDLWTAYGEQIRRQRHDDESGSSDHGDELERLDVERQREIRFDDPPF